LEPDIEHSQDLDFWSRTAASSPITPSPRIAMTITAKPVPIMTNRSPDKPNYTALHDSQTWRRASTCSTMIHVDVQVDLEIAGGFVNAVRLEQPLRMPSFYRTSNGCGEGCPHPQTDQSP
jgi:hypothetical protein